MPERADGTEALQQAINSIVDHSDHVQSHLRRLTEDVAKIISNDPGEAMRVISAAVTDAYKAGMLAGLMVSKTRELLTNLPKP